MGAPPHTMLGEASLPSHKRPQVGHSRRFGFSFNAQYFKYLANMEDPTNSSISEDGSACTGCDEAEPDQEAAEGPDSEADCSPNGQITGTLPEVIRFTQYSPMQDVHNKPPQARDTPTSPEQQPKQIGQEKSGLLSRKGEPRSRLNAFGVLCPLCGCVMLAA